MIVFMLKSLFLIFCFNLPQQPSGAASTVETIVVETTTQYVQIITDIPQSDVELAMHHDYGRYTTMVFNYVNKQFDLLNKKENCYDEHIKCIISLAVTTPVCAVNDPDDRKYKPRGFNTFNSYCDAYFDNCLRQMRYWRILDIGRCNFTGPYDDFEIRPYRKYFGFQPKNYIWTKI
ncbi:uncharacterized protein LOC124539594 [Vanessa cardui]|uniref:uncharacterized protein LOC124539594 n=1 Tax=Vanessa cardui TaxID=171605 RepID=UPI001F12EFA7|nr:uncharacterized protein LOC124539594 [Vanessa cardui]